LFYEIQYQIFEFTGGFIVLNKCEGDDKYSQLEEGTEESDNPLTF
jgi:hypothetical protein